MKNPDEILVHQSLIAGAIFAFASRCSIHSSEYADGLIETRFDRQGPSHGEESASVGRSNGLLP